MIEAVQLCKSFKHTHAVDGVSLSVAPGEIYGLVGPDGAGKTTTLRLLCGVLTPDAGSATVAGFDLTHHLEGARARIGYLSQRFSLYEEMTVLENLRFFAEVRGLARADWLGRSAEILHFVGLDEFGGRRAGQLSGGMKQKLGLAIALVTRPGVLLLDEPTTGVDPLTRQDFWQLIIRLAAEEQVAVLISTPYMDEAARCKRVGFLRNGKMVAEGTPRELRARLDGRVLELAGGPPDVLLRVTRGVEGVESVQRFGELFHLIVKDGQAEAVRERLTGKIQEAGGQLDRIQATPALLEDVFISLSGRSL
jgi:ABC-2 type transport system ATP-binding protein